MILLHNQESWPLTYCQHYTVAGTRTLGYSHQTTLVAHKLVALVVHKHVALLAHTLMSTLVAHTLGLLVIMHKRRCLTVLVVIVGMAAKQRKSQRSLFNRFQWGLGALIWIVINGYFLFSICDEFSQDMAYKLILILSRKESGNATFCFMRTMQHWIDKLDLKTQSCAMIFFLKPQQSRSRTIKACVSLYAVWDFYFKKNFNLFSKLISCFLSGGDKTVTR